MNIRSLLTILILVLVVVLGWWLWQSYVSAPQVQTPALTTEQELDAISVEDINGGLQDIDKDLNTL